MAKTYSYADALAYVGQYAARAQNDIARQYALNEAVSTLWNFADWRETIAPLPPFYLYPGEQDYGKPTYTIPSDFHGLREIYLVNLQADYLNRRVMEVQKNIEVTHYRDFPTRICYNPTGLLGAGCFRVWPRVPDGLGATQYCIDGTYKKRAPKITADNLNTILIWDDEYFGTFCAVLYWAVLPPGEQKDKAFAYATALMNSMAEKEGLNDGDDTIAPDMPLVNPWLRL